MNKKMKIPGRIEQIFYQNYPLLRGKLNASLLLEGLLKAIPQPLENMDKVEYTKDSFDILAKTAFYYAKKFDELFAGASEQDPQD